MVRQIPRGFVASYKDIAEACGFRGQYRLIGYALHALPRGTGVPWHRVVNSSGRISLPKGRGYERQRKLLEREGVRFTNDRIDMARFGWWGVHHEPVS